MLVSLPRNAAGAHRVFAQGERRQRRWRWEGGVVKQNDSDLNLERLVRSASPRAPGLVVNRSRRSALVFCLVFEQGRRGIEIVIEKKKWLFKVCWNTLAALFASCSPV